MPQPKGRKAYNRLTCVLHGHVRLLFVGTCNKRDMIEITNLTKRFGDLQVLKGVSLKVERGEIISIVGPSGAGKTTLLQLIGTLDKPDGGSIVFDGEDLCRMNKKRLAAFRNRHIGFVFQSVALIPIMNAY